MKRRKKAVPAPRPDGRPLGNARGFRIGISLILFLAVFLIYCNGEVFPSFDTIWATYTGMSIIKEGNTDLDEYRAIVEYVRGASYSVETIKGHLYWKFPPGTALIVTPFLFFADTSYRLLYDVSLSDVMKYSVPRNLEMFIASFLVALTAVLIFRIALQEIVPVHSALLAICFSFCTTAWSVASRALWQHGPSMLLLTSALYLAVLAKRKPSAIQYLAVPIGLAYIVRPTNSIAALGFSIFIFLQYRRYFIQYLLWGLAVAVPFLFFNYRVYDSLISPYYLPQRVGIHPAFLEALAGNLISPARGLLVYSPIFLFAIYGFFVKAKNRELEKLDITLALIILGHWVAISSFPHWWGGWSFGPRFFTDMSPLLIYLIIPALRRGLNMKGGIKIAFVGIFTIATLLSIFIHYKGATNWGPYAWNFTPSNIDQRPDRLWDWNDLQFMRNLPPSR